MTQGSEEKAYLGVERSVSGKRWRSRGGDERLAMGLSQRFQLPEIAGRVLAARGVGFDDAAVFLNPSLRDMMPDPSELKDMDAAAERLAAAVRRQEVIAIFGDYDVDGATSSAVLKRYLSACGARVLVHIPDRMTEGYGPNGPALRRLKDQGAAVAVTVDCGITAFAALEDASEAGLDVIIVDHHAAEPQLPIASAIVNPNRLDEDGSLGHLAAVGVVFLLVVALNRALRDAGWFKDRHQPDMMGLLDLVALGTVCDVVPLKGLNRAYVTQGLKVMSQRRNRGIAALADVAGVDEVPGAYHLGFVLGPRVNAGGRVGEATLGTRLLSSDNPAEAEQIARQLDGFNRERKALEDLAITEAVEQVDAKGGDRAMAMAVGENWHPGVIGIVAGRLKERYNLPGLVLAKQEGVYKGSGRSVPGLDLGAAIIAARQSGLLLMGGGHPMAAGFTVEEEKLSAFEAFLEQRFAKQIAESALVPSLGLDGTLHPNGATPHLMSALEKVGPFGQGNPQPRFAFADARLVKADVVGQNHVRCILSGAEGMGRLKAISFRSLETELGQALLHAGGRPIHIAGHLKRDNWQGRDGVQLIIDDAALV